MRHFKNLQYFAIFLLLSDMKETEMFVMALFGFDRGHRAYLAMEGTGAKIYPSATVNFLAVFL